MKKLLFLVVLLLGFAACSNEEDSTGQQRQQNDLSVAGSIARSYEIRQFEAACNGESLVLETPGFATCQFKKLTDDSVQFELWFNSDAKSHELTVSKVSLQGERFHVRMDDTSSDALFVIDDQRFNEVEVEISGSMNRAFDMRTELAPFDYRCDLQIVVKCGEDHYTFGLYELYDTI
ncbi:MAG: hypothetical protein E7137_06055 [Rikenellaceae bacterium]|nr:hypothetical protein [Rikenellaceae bacterium]